MAGSVKLQEQILETSNQMIDVVVSALSRDFKNVFFVDLDKDEVFVIKLSGYRARGLEPDSKKNCPYSKLYRNYVDDRVHPDDRQMMRQALSVQNVRNQLESDDEYVVTYRILEKDETHYYQVKFARAAGSFKIVMGFQNVDSIVAVERKRQEEMDALRENERFRKKVLSSLAKVYFCVYYVDLKTGAYQELSNTEEQSIKSYIGPSGDAREKLKVMSGQMVVPEQSQMVADFINLDTLPERLKGQDSISIRFNGMFVGWCEGMFVAVDRDESGECTKALWVIRSIKDEMAKELENKDRLEKALQRANRANAAKSEFLARMSHDIRTPLNGIIGVLDLVEKRRHDPELHELYHRKAKVAANHLLSLLNDVLEMGKLEDSEIPLEEEPFNLLEILSEVYTIANLRAEERNVTVVHDNYIDLKYPNLYGSPLYIRQIFLNLVINSIKYNKVGGTVMCHSEIVGKTPDSVIYCFHVDDTGIGMTQEFMERIYEPFSQERTDARSSYPGAGMGMAIVKRLVDKMNGNISITSEPGKGSRFSVTIPFRIDKHPKKSRTDIDVDIPLDGMKVLLVEDNDLNMEVAKDLLEDLGVSVICARDGQEAVDIFEKMEAGSLDLILMDLMMPVLDGYGATKKIRLSQKKDASRIPIIALSANAFAEDVRRSKNAGMNGHLAKPINIPLLKQTLAKYKK